MGSGLHGVVVYTREGGERITERYREGEREHAHVRIVELGARGDGKKMDRVMQWEERGRATCLVKISGAHIRDR